MLHIKANVSSVSAIRTSTGNIKDIGHLSFISSTPQLTENPVDNPSLHISGVSYGSNAVSTVHARMDENGVYHQDKILTQISFKSSGTSYMEPNVKRTIEHRNAVIELERNSELVYQQDDSIVIRMEHMITPTHGDRDRPVRFKLNNLVGELQATTEFNVSESYMYGENIYAIDIDNNYLIDCFEYPRLWRHPVAYSSGDNIFYYHRDGIQYFMFDVLLKKTTKPIKGFYVRANSGGAWEITIPEELRTASMELASDRAIRCRFAVASCGTTMVGEGPVLPPTWSDIQYLGQATELLEQSIAEDGLSGTFKLNAPTLTSVYLNGVQITNRLKTTQAGEFTVSFPYNVNNGATIEIRSLMELPVDAYHNFTIVIEDTIPPEPAFATFFTPRKIIGEGVAETRVYAVRDDIVIGDVLIPISGEYTMDLYPNVVLASGEIVGIYTQDEAGNKSNIEQYEIEVINESSGVFNPATGNDALVISR